MRHELFQVTLRDHVVMYNTRTFQSIKVGPGKYIFYERPNPYPNLGGLWLVSRQIRKDSEVGMSADGLRFICNQNPQTAWRDWQGTIEPYVQEKVVPLFQQGIPANNRTTHRQRRRQHRLKVKAKKVQDT